MTFFVVGASVLHSVPDDLGKIARKLVKYWWTEHGMSMQKLEEDNRVNFATIHFNDKEGWGRLIFANNSGFLQPEVDDGPEGAGRGDGVKGSAGDAGGNTQAELSTVKAASAKAVAANAAAATEISPEAEIPQRSEV
jgi:hypothetical protein